MLRCPAAGSSALRTVLAAPARPAECLGVTRGALYLKIAGPPGALAVLTHDAVRLPCGLLLATTSTELPLTSLAPPSLAQGSPDPSVGFVVGDGAVSWTGPEGPVVVRAVREWAPARVVRGEVAASALAAARAMVSDAGPRDAVLSGADLGRADLGRADPGSADPDCAGPGSAGPGSGDPECADPGCADSGCADRGSSGPGSGEPGSGDPGGHSWPLADLPAAASDRDAAVAVAMCLLGSGPGLTPSGDDVLAGFLTGAAAFGVHAAALHEATAVLAPARTTALSAALLWHAARGECIDELAGVTAALTGQRPPEQVRHAVGRLLAIGHTSGTALTAGLLIAADTALRAQAVLAETVLAETVLAETGRARAESVSAEKGRAA